jgi:hypothetical protein
VRRLDQRSQVYAPSRDPLYGQTFWAPSRRLGLTGAPARYGVAEPNLTARRERKSGSARRHRPFRPSF